MEHLKIANRYAASLLDTALEQHVLTHIYNDAVFFMELLKADNQALSMVLETPIITSSAKLQALSRLLKPKVHPLMFDFCTMVTRRRREAILPSMVESFLEQYYAYKKIALASVITTFKLTNDLVDHFKALVQQLTLCNEVILREYVTPSIQGGFILRVADKQIDRSLLTKFKALRNKFAVLY